MQGVRMMTRVYTQLSRRCFWSCVHARGCDLFRGREARRPCKTTRELPRCPRPKSGEHRSLLGEPHKASALRSGKADYLVVFVDGATAQQNTRILACVDHCASPWDNGHDTVPEALHRQIGRRDSKAYGRNGTSARQFSMVKPPRRTQARR
jgi:hypothetical protein